MKCARIALALAWLESLQSISAMDAAAWRRLWRRRGVALDRLLCIAFSIPAPEPESLSSRVPRRVVLPGGVRDTLQDEDVNVVVAAAIFTMNYLAEFLPVAITCNDAKPLLPGLASRLAVCNAPGGEKEFMGSFDMLARMCATRTTLWKPYNGFEMAIDVELTGAQLFWVSMGTLSALTLSMREP